MRHDDQSALMRNFIQHILYWYITRFSRNDVIRDLDMQISGCLAVRCLRLS